jgi:hypothetical protein
MTMRNLVVAITILAAAGVAGATVTTSHSTQPMAGGTAWDIQLSSDCDWTNSRITVVLSEGSLIDPLVFNFHFAGLNDQDTWVDAASSVDTNTAVIVNSLEGGEVMDWSWYDTSNDGPQTWLAARVILSNDAVGVAYLQNFDVRTPGVAQLAEVPIPEPATLALLGFGALGALLRRR